MSRELLKETQRSTYDPMSHPTPTETRDDPQDHPDNNEDEDSLTSSTHESDWSHIPGNEIGDHDVILGRGIGKSHQGNIKFRALVRQHKFRYLSAPKVQKPQVAASVVKIWRELKPPGRFLARKESASGICGTLRDQFIRKEVWYDVGDKRAREKASMSLRERTPEFLPVVNMMKEREQRTPILTPQLFRSFESASRDADHRPSDWFIGVCPPRSYSRDPYAERVHFVIPPPPSVRSTPSSSSSSIKGDRAVPPVPAAGWRDYSVGRGTTHTRHESLEEDGGAPLMGDPAHQGAPYTKLEVRLHHKVRQMRSQIEEQRKVIETLQSELATKASTTQDPSGNGSDSNDPLGVAPSLPNTGATAANLVLSPMPYSAETDLQDENEVGLENYHNILLDCFRGEDSSTNPRGSRYTTTNVSNTHNNNKKDQQQDPLEILRVTPLPPRSLLASTDGTKTSTTKTSGGSDSSKNNGNPDATAFSATLVPSPPKKLQPLRRSIAWENNNTNWTFSGMTLSMKGLSTGEETLSSPPHRWNNNKTRTNEECVAVELIKSSTGNKSSPLRTRRNGPILLPRGSGGGELFLATTPRGVKRTKSGTPVSSSKSSNKQASPLIEHLMDGVNKKNRVSLSAPREHPGATNEDRMEDSPRRTTVIRKD